MYELFKDYINAIKCKAMIWTGNFILPGFCQYNEISPGKETSDADTNYSWQLYMRMLDTKIPNAQYPHNIGSA